MARKRKPGSESAGYHSDLSIPGYKPKTPTKAPKPSQAATGPAGDYAGAGREYESAVAALPAAAQAVTEKAGAAAHAASVVKRAERRQKRLVAKYVTKAYAKKLERKGVPGLEIGGRIEKAKDEIQRERDRLLSHPDVEAANSEGKVLGAKGLSKLGKQPTRKEQEGVIQKTIGSLTKPRTAPKVPTIGPKGSTTGKSWSPGNPLAIAVEKDVIGPLQSEGKLPEHPTTGQKIYQKVAEYGPLVISMTPELTAGAKALNVGLRGAEVGGERVAGNLLSRVLKPVAADTPEARAAVAATRKSAVSDMATREATLGQKASAGAKRLLEAGTKGSRQRALARSVTGAQTRKEAARAGGFPLLATKAGTPTGSSIIEGTGQAFSSPKNAKETLLTTGRALPAVVTAPAALLYSAGKIPSEGTGPLENTATMQFEGLRQIGENLLSGNPDKVQQAVEKEGALTLLAGAPALTRTRAYKALRGSTRDVAAGARRITGIGRQAPKGVEQNVFAFTEKKGARKRVALAHARTSNPQSISEAHHSKAILTGTDPLRPALSGAPEGSHVALQTLLEYGIRSPEGVKLVRERGPKSEPSVEGRVNLHEALKYAEDHPEIFTNKAFNRALEAGARASETTPMGMREMGQVARHRGQGDLFGILPPEKRVPLDARKYTSARTREGAWKQLKEMETRLTSLKAKRQSKGPKGKQAPRRTQEIKALEERTVGLKKALDPYTRPDQQSLSGERKAWSEGLEQEYLREVKMAQEKSPLVAPVWTHHATFRGSKMGIEGSSLPGTAGGKVHVRKGSLAEHDLVDRSLEAFIRGTVQMPRRRQAGAEFAREFVESEKLPFNLKGNKAEIVPDSETWARITGKKTKENPDGGQYDPKTYARFPLRQWKSAVEDPLSTNADLGALLADAEAGRIKGHEPSVIVPREAIREFAEKVNPNPGAVTEFTSRWSRRASKAILATNPAWVAAQIPAEAIPLLMAHPELLNPAKTGSILRDISKFRKEHPEEAAMIEGSAGASPQITAGSLRSPLDLDKQAAFNPQPAMFAEGAKQMTRGPIGRAMISTAKLEPLGLFDVKRQNAYRTVLLAAEADKQFRGFTSGVRNYFRKSAKLSERFRGKSREELWKWLSTTKEGKAELRKLADYVDNIQGNWTAFTRYERAFAPLVIFYPFLRYSLRWTLWTFPKTHPLTATLAFMLGQANSNELEKVLGEKPASPLWLSYPVVKDAQGKPSVLPGGSRISPGQSALQQAAASQEAPQLLSAINPILGAGLTALGGPGPFGQKPSGPAGWAAVDQLLSLPAPLRVIMNETGIHSEEAFASIFNKPVAPESIISIAFKKLDPEKSKRSVLFPGIPQSAERAKMSNRLSKALKTAEENSESRRSDVAGDDSLTVQDRRTKIKAMEAKAEKAKEVIDGVLKKLGLDKENQEAYERWKASMYPPEETGGFHSSGYETGGYEPTGYDGGEGGKALQYKPPSGAIKIPGLGGVLGSVTSPLAALVGGEKAQAAELPKALQRKTVGNPTRQQLIAAGKAGTLTVNHKGKILTPEVRKAGKELRRAYSRAKPTIEGFASKDQQQFAEWFSHYTKIPPKLAGEWVKQEGGGWGSDGVSGGQAGEQNWLGVGYPGQTTPMSESKYFNGVSPKQAAKNTALWIEGKIGHEYSYRAAPSIQVIGKMAKEGAPESALRSYIEGPSAWGTGAISQSGIVVREPKGNAAKALRVAKRNARAVGLNPTPFNGDVERGQGKTVTVRADAKGMVNWASSAVGTPEGSPRQLRYNAKAGISASEPWCAAFIASGLERRGVTPPANPAYSGSYLDPSWKGGKQIGADLSKAKPGDLVVYGSSDHIALYVGNGEVIAGNYGDEVARYKSSEDSRGIQGIVRPKYRGGKIQIHESTVLPGATSEATFAAAPSGVGSIPEYEGSPSSPNRTNQKGRKGMTAAQRLQLVNQISEGNLKRFGIPGFTPQVGPSVSSLAELGRSLESGRRELQRI